MSAITDPESITENSAQQSPPKGLSQEIAFNVLSNQRRRYVLHYLFQKDRPVELRELSTQIAAWENDIPPDRVSYDQRTRVYTALRQAHLPKMAEANVITFDAQRGVAELTTSASELEVYLDVVPHDDIPWSQYYTGIAGLSFALLVGTHVDLFPLYLLSGYGWALLIATLFAVSSLFHFHHEHCHRLGMEGKPPL